MTFAYSYLRFSTPEQMQGDSFRRQAEAARVYAERHGLTLDTKLTFQDLGVSAFRGRNVNRGSLKDFRRAVEGKVVKRGSYLLIESFDRLTRMDPWDALPVFQEIINAGITIVTLQDERSWNRECIRDNPFRILESLIVMVRAHDESASKGRRVRASLNAKREAVRNGDRKIYSARCPSWLQIKSDRSGFQIIGVRAKVIRRIYRMGLQGESNRGIAVRLNSEGVATWSDKTRAPAKYWRYACISRILRNPAVIGTFVPRTSDEIDGRRERRILDPIVKYYPPIVDRQLYRKVQAITALRKPPSRRTVGESPVRNLLGGLAKCEQCRGAMTRVIKASSRKPGHPYLICAGARDGVGCKYQPLRLDRIEARLREEAWTIVADAPPPEYHACHDTAISEIENRMTNARNEIGRVVSAIRRRSSIALNEELRQLEQEVEDLQYKRGKLLRIREATFGPLVKARLRALGEVLEAEPFDYAAANARLRECLFGVLVDPKKKNLSFEWRHGGVSKFEFGPRG